jgi:lipopolysaccharide/colanic/teichoic acid biosynthesis glycosyltransferase
MNLKLPARFAFFFGGTLIALALPFQPHFLWAPGASERALFISLTLFATALFFLWRQSITPGGAHLRTECAGSQVDYSAARRRNTNSLIAREGYAARTEVSASVSELDELVEHGIPQLVPVNDPGAGFATLRGAGLRWPFDFASQSRRSSKSDLAERHTLRRLKRGCDILLSVAALIFFWPLLMLCAIAIRLDSPGPIIFRQARVGWRGKTFTIFKLRTMRNDSELGPRWAEVNDARVTRVGRVLRLTHIDELPQLINVLRGEMSFVGPRPERPEFVEKLNRQIPNYDVRHFLLPGITGWAQVNFRYGASVADARKKLEFDLYYVMNASLILDLLIVLKTVRVVLLMRGSR